MSYTTDRVVLFDKNGDPLGELAPDEVLGRVRYEEINERHDLTLRTTRVLEVGTRILTIDSTGRWREWVVSEPDEAHESGDHAVGTYVCPWSLQYDLTWVYDHEHAEPGMGSWCSSADAVGMAISGTSRWSVGTCDVPGVDPGKGCVLIGENAWDRLGKVVEAFGGEVDAEIEVGSHGIVSRSVSLRAHLGGGVTRRFDWSRDLVGVHRRPDPGPYFCRVVPLGNGQQEYAEDDETEFDWPLDITEETDGIPYIQDDDAAEAFKVSDGNGGWEYPTKVVTYSEDDPELLLAAATEDLHNHTRPNVTYEANVMQLAEAGMDVRGVQLGDDVHVVDRGFNPGSALRIEGRVVAMEVDERDTKGGTTLTIGQMTTGFDDVMRELYTAPLQEVTGQVRRISGAGTIVYLQNLLDQINAEVNATGGYTYLVPGHGVVTYDVEVSDPLVGTEATQVTQTKGGTTRFANTKGAGFQGINDWEWQTVITPEGYMGLAATIGKMTAGFIRSADGNVEINLDSGTFRFGPSAMMGDISIGDAIDDARRYATDYLAYENGELTLGAIDSVIKNVLTNERMKFVTDNGDVAWFGLNDQDIWELFIETASIQNRLSFGDFSWIARQNGNMTIKWVGA